MKVIDKLVDIANNGVSEIIQYFRYYNRNDKQFESCMLNLDNLIYKLNNGALDINDEIEIIEDTSKEDKKISKEIEWYMIDPQDQEKTKVAQTNMNFKIMREKIYELIDTINEMKGK